MLVDVMSGRCEVSVAIAFRAAKVLDASIYGRDRRDRAAGRHLPALRQGAERALAWNGKRYLYRCRYDHTTIFTWTHYPQANFT